MPSNSDTPLVVDLTDADPLCKFIEQLPFIMIFTWISVDHSVIFWSPEVKVDEKAVYQITLATPPRVHISSLPFTSLAVYIKEDFPPITVRHVESESPAGLVQEIRLGHLDYNSPPAESPVVEANLRWRPGSSVVLNGSLSSAQPTTISVSALKALMLIHAHKENRS